MLGSAIYGLIFEKHATSSVNQAKVSSKKLKLRVLWQMVIF
ncbi:hypothetical protein HSISB1_604 [Streptococcus sp. HSISB1]|nr:hypothetical protein HSISB1_604 [Streptococcus sp. HSISB1]